MLNQRTNWRMQVLAIRSYTNYELHANQFSILFHFTYAQRVCGTRRCQCTRRNFFSRVQPVEYIHSEAISQRCRCRRAIKPVRSHNFLLFSFRALFCFSISSLLGEIYKITYEMPWSHEQYRVWMVAAQRRQTYMIYKMEYAKVKQMVQVQWLEWLTGWRRPVPADVNS